MLELNRRNTCKGRESNTIKGVDAILEDIMKGIVNRFKGHSGNINVHPLIIKLLIWKMLKKDYEFVYTFSVFDETDNKCNKRY